MIAFTILGLLVFWLLCFGLGYAGGLLWDIKRGIDKFIAGGDVDAETKEIIAFMSVVGVRL